MIVVFAGQAGLQRKEVIRRLIDYAESQKPKPREIDFTWPEVGDDEKEPRPQRRQGFDLQDFLEAGSSAARERDWNTAGERIVDLAEVCRKADKHLFVAMHGTFHRYGETWASGIPTFSNAFAPTCL